MQVIVAQLSFITQDQDEESYEVNEIITHPDFNPTTHLNDIALIQVFRTLFLRFFKFKFLFMDQLL